MRLRRILGLGLLAGLIGFGAAIWGYHRYVVYSEPRLGWASDGGHTGSEAAQPATAGVVRILSLDGGAVCGLIALEVLKAIERKAARPISQLFDLVAGASTGAVIATQLLLPDRDGKPKYDVDAVTDSYSTLVSQVFDAPWYHRLLTLDGLVGPKYLNVRRIALAQQIYGDALFGDLLAATVVPIYFMRDSQVSFVTSWAPPGDQMYLTPLLEAATSAPTLFPAIELQGSADWAGQYIDGAVLDNDPSLQALLYALRRFPDAEVVMVSLGTGLPTMRVDQREATHGGLLAWLGDLIAMSVDGRGGLTAAWLEEYAKTRAGSGLHYYRINTDLPPDDADCYDSSAENIRFLQAIGKGLVESSGAIIDEAVARLVPVGRS